MKIKTRDLTGAALDWAVAKCEGRDYTYSVHHGGDYNGWTSGPHYRRYSTDWAQGGPIIASMKEYCQEKNGDECYCSTPSVAEDWHNHPVQGTGPTPLIAAMRCYVASKLGDEVDVPEELT